MHPPSPLVQRVHHQLRARIASGEYAANSRLPGEHDLAALYGVSRPIVRDALRRLRDDGLIFSRQGAGTYVRGVEPEQGNALAFAPVGTIADVQRCYEFRLEVEPANAFYAAKRRNDAAIAAIESALELMRDTTRAHGHREDADYAFHMAIAEASNNYFFLSSMQALRDHINVGMKLHGLSLLGPQAAWLESLTSMTRSLPRYAIGMANWLAMLCGDTFKALATASSKAGCSTSHFRSPFTCRKGTVCQLASKRDGEL